jgi:hypothetical protein
MFALREVWIYQNSLSFKVLVFKIPPVLNFNYVSTDQFNAGEKFYSLRIHLISIQNLF